MKARIGVSSVALIILSIMLVSIMPITAAGAKRKGSSALRGKKAQQRKQYIKKATGKMIHISAGTFTMGSPYGDVAEEDELPVHEVSVDAFYIGKNEVTFEQYDRFYQTTKRKRPSDNGWGRGKRPAINVSWHDAVAFCDWLSKLSGKKFRLPTEAEWEYACRAGTETDFSFGTATDDVERYAWYRDNSRGKSQPVGKRKGNPWRLTDMHGNVREWCSDWYDENYYKNSPPVNPPGPESGTYRVVRGGSWALSSGFIRSGIRGGKKPDRKSNYIGFRLVREEE